MIEKNKVNLSKQETEKAYQEIVQACMIYKDIRPDGTSIANHKKGCDILIKYFGGSNPLFDVNEPIPGQFGWTPLLFATYSKATEEVKCLLGLGAKHDYAEPSSGKKPIHLAAAHSKAILCHIFLENGEDVNVLTTKKQTPLMFAAESGALDVAKILMRKEPNVLLLDLDGQSYIDYANKNNNKPIISYIQYSTLRKDNQKLNKKNSFTKI